MSPASALSLATALVSAIVGAVTLVVTRGARQQSFRWYAAASFLAGLFSAGNVVVGMKASEATVLLAGRFTLCVAGLHSVAWVAHDIDNSGRRATRGEIVSMVVAVGLALLAWIPGLLVSPVVVNRDAWFGLVYRDYVPTPLGSATFGYYCLSIAALVARNARQVARGDRRLLPQLVGLSTLTVAAILDSLAAAQVTRMPYVLDVALMVVVLCVGVSLAARYVETTRALDESSRQLADAQRELVARERLAAVGEMSAVVAHEVRNPLAVMFNALGGLRRELGRAPTAQASELLDILDEEADRLRRLVDDFLDFARPLALRPATVDARGLVESALEMARAAAPSSHRLTAAIPDALGELRCDVQLVKHAIANLVENALQIEGPPIDITLTARGTESRVILEVTDHGPGISEPHAARLFSPFFTTRAQGTGLGLTIAKRIVEAHFGTIEHRTTHGGGATFVVDLPRTRTTSADARMLSEPPAG